MKKILLVSSLIVICILLSEALRENVRMDWRKYQARYKKELLHMASTPQEKQAAGQYEIKMRQVVLPELNRVDRCVICHAATEDSRMTHMPQPLRAHPDTILEDHELEKVGCTICHDGQGRAITMQNAHAVRHDKYWEKPVLAEPFVESNCYRCHNQILAATPHYNAGKTLFETKGCLGCHQINGKGGVDGPDLSNLANASFHVKMPVPENREPFLNQFHENVNLAFIYESVKDPHAQPKNSAMVDYQFSDEEAHNLTVYLKSLSTEEIPKSLLPTETKKFVPTAQQRGARSYGMYCSACHGAQGKGAHLAELAKIGPAISNKEFLSIVDEKWLHHAVSFSRGAEMPAFKTTGGLSEEEIKDIVDYLQSFKMTPPTFEDVMAEEGDARYGEQFFYGNCASCHGIGGTYSRDLIGPTLHNPTLLGLATRRFWYQTIVNGRSGTAMPSWHFLEKEQLADLMAYLESLVPVPLNKGRTLALLWTAPSLEDGKRLFEGQCAVCHGLDGQGGLGPNLRNKEFQRVADAGFIFDVMAQGRPGTAMPSWNHLAEEDVTDIIHYIKSWQVGEATELSDERISGSEREGEIIFARACAQCHGDARRGMLAPAILSEGFLTQATDSFIKEMTMHGREATPMRPAQKSRGGISELSEDEINAVVAYIRSFEDSPVELTGRPTVQGDIFSGKALFARNCAQCHGPFAEGGNGPAIGKKGFLDTVSDGFIMAMMRLGRPGSEMKAFPPHGDGFSNLSEKEIADIVSFLRSDLHQADRYAKKVRGVPSHGKELFTRNCAQCHGPDGRGGIAPDLNNKIFMDSVSDSYLQATMALGRHNTPMRSMMKGGGGVVELSSQDVNSIVRYLRSLGSSKE